jgi:hypothetical protein
VRDQKEAAARGISSVPVAAEVQIGGPKIGSRLCGLQLRGFLQTGEVKLTVSTVKTYSGTEEDLV